MSIWDSTDPKYIKEKYKETLKNHKLKIAKMNKLLKSSRSEVSRVKYEEKINEMKLKMYKERKEKFGFYEKINQLKQKYQGKRNLTKEQFLEWKKWQRSIIGKAERAYNRFLKANKNLDFNMVSVNVKNKYGAEKFSLTYLLNQTQKVFPTNTQEFEDLKKVSNKAFQRLRHIKAEKSRYWKNVSMHLGDIYTDAGKGYDDKGKEIEYDESEKGKIIDKYEKEWNADEFNEYEDEMYDGMTDEEVEEAMVEYEGDESEKPDVHKMENIKYYAGFKMIFNVSETNLIENIETHEREFVTENDFNDLQDHIKRNGYYNKVNMNRLRASIRRMETWRKKRMNKGNDKNWWRKKDK